MTRCIFILCALIAAPVDAEVRLPKILQSHMVLQRNSDVKIWGWADPGETVTVAGDWINEPQIVDPGADGTWEVSLSTGESGAAHTLTISATNTITLQDILFGEVWVASGQSNMEMPLVAVSGAYTGIANAADEVANANYPNIRLFQVGNFSSKDPLDDVQPGIVMYGIPPAACTWQSCTPETIPTFSSTAYFFARMLHSELDIPIGIIDASWGGTSAETWTPRAGLIELGYEAELNQAATRPQQSDQKIPTRLYNGMIHPLRNLKIKGCIWYQGEGNAGRADKYHSLFSTMIVQWRKAFGDEFPFYFVQIAPYNYGGNQAAYLREAQHQTLSLPKTGMVVTMDIGNLTDIHPKNKQAVGRRLALWALAKDYGKKITVSGPSYLELEFTGTEARLTFDHQGRGLMTSDGEPPSDFQIAGEDKVFHPATAVIQGDQIVVSSDQVVSPKAVRYAFTSDAMPNLMNHDGLPAIPFRTDQW